MASGFVDLRSDTVTRPTPEMRRAMADAEVGDDVYGEDPTVNALQEAFAARVGKQAALFVPSGTMGNQLALRLLTTPGTSVIAGRRQHVVIYENGAGGRNAGIQFWPVVDDDGTIDAADVRWAIAAAGLVALRTMVDALADDHTRARLLADAVAERWPDSGVDPARVQTNCVTFGHREADELCDHLRHEGVLAGTIAPGVVRLMTHHDVDDEGVERACKALAAAP